MRENKKLKITEYFSEVELTSAYEPCFCSVEDAITIVMVGTFCGFRNLKQIHQWAKREKIKEIFMECYDTALHIVSAQISELGLTFGEEAVQGKSNEIPATQRLIKMLRLKDCVVVADALNCQKDTAAAIIAQKAIIY